MKGFNSNFKAIEERISDWKIYLNKLFRIQCWETKSWGRICKKNKKAKDFQNWWKRLTHTATRQIPGKINGKYSYIAILLWNYRELTMPR